VRKTLREIADFIGGEVVGDGQIVITGISGIKEASEGEITFLANSKYSLLIEKTHASAIIVPRDLLTVDKPAIRTDNPPWLLLRRSLCLILRK
jgi:UDP-3-O-[3-hydroxymyristoyl] glucosamine N-acyltransferase